MEQFFKPKSPPKPVVLTKNAKKKRVHVSLVIGEDDLGHIQQFHGGTVAEALRKFIESQLCKQAEVESVDIKKRFVQKS